MIVNSVTPWEELQPLYDVEHVAFLLAYRLRYPKATGYAYKVGKLQMHGYDVIICDTDADYQVARLSGMQFENGELTTRAKMMKEACNIAHDTVTKETTCAI